MSEKMYPIPFRSLMNWVVTEYSGCGDVFGVHKQYHATGKSLPIFGERIETPLALPPVPTASWLRTSSPPMWPVPGSSR